MRQTAPGTQLFLHPVVSVLMLPCLLRAREAGTVCERVLCCFRVLDSRAAEIDLVAFITHDTRILFYQQQHGQG